MSADNGIYIAKFPDGYRFCYGSGIENLTYYPEGTPERRAELKIYFGNSPVFANEEDCWLAAVNKSKEYDFLEYGVSYIGEFEAFKNMHIRCV